MKNKNEFLNKFISRYYSIAQVKRRSSKNKAYYICQTINNVCKNYFDKKIKFEENDIYKAFDFNGFTIMESGVNDFTWDRFHNAHILITCDLFINIIPQNNHDLKLALRRSSSENWKPETIEKVEALRVDLMVFWLENKHLITN